MLALVTHSPSRSSGPSPVPLLCARRRWGVKAAGFAHCDAVAVGRNHGRACKRVVPQRGPLCRCHSVCRILVMTRYWGCVALSVLKPCMHWSYADPGAHHRYSAPPRHQRLVTIITSMVSALTGLPQQRMARRITRRRSGQAQCLQSYRPRPVLQKSRPPAAPSGYSKANTACAARHTPTWRRCGRCSGEGNPRSPRRGRCAPTPHPLAQ